VDALSIRKGSLTRDEYRQIQEHAELSYQFLSKIAWTGELKQVPAIAHAHHEKLNGKGYPLGLTSEKILLQSKLMTVADIYDALTAADRPYKKAMPVERAISILREEVKFGGLDADIVELFVERELWKLTLAESQGASCVATTSA
jgi:HD-GYP domain-containing protein (c-di-GMP phosphodiesterase class II)